MSLRKLLDNPSGGQLLSAIMVIVLLVLAEAMFAFSVYRSVSSGSEVRVNDLLLMLLIGSGIGSAVNYVRKRHGTA
jgi:hypothetical protein